jgi:hypothetical protein
MKSSAFKIGSAFAILVVLTIVAFEGKNLSQQLGVTEKDPVLVFVIPSMENARRVRAAIAPERIALQSKKGLALVGGRVVALSLDDAGDVIEEAGWVDHPIQIVRLEDPETDEGEELEAGSNEARLARLRSLVNKPTLTRGEQMFVLMAMNDGIEL